MCGIAGFVDFNCRLSEEHLTKMTEVIAHRGPDDKGHALVINSFAHVGLGHRRLSILDLSPQGHQPMNFNGYHIIFNGEIYNFKEIRVQLEEMGQLFKSHSDTEVILKAFIEWGVKSVDRFIGMFVFVIYNQHNDELFILRDRAGVKPVYYYWKNNTFLFASELKSFHVVPGFEKKLNLQAVRMFLNLGYIPTPHCIYSDTFKVKPGSYLHLNLRSKKFEENTYWNAAGFYNKPKLDISFDEACQEIERLLTSAFNYRMVADVPVGVFLSGGYDSSILAAILQKHSHSQIKTFTIGFNETAFNEANHAKSIASYLGTEHTEQYCSAKDAFDILPKIPVIYDEPFGDSSAIPTTLVSKLAVRDVKVALSADAGDEIFAGYNKYATFLKYFKLYSRIPDSLTSPLAWGTKNIGGFLRVFFKNTYNFDTRVYKASELLHSGGNLNKFFKVLSQFYGDIELDNLIIGESQTTDAITFFDEPLNGESDDLDKMLAIDYKTYMLDDILTKVDRATMSVSLEGREPLLDHRILEFAAQLPSHYKYSNGTTKRILKHITHKYIPQPMVDRPKMGFGIPMEVWLKDDLRPLVEYYFDDKRIKRNNLFDHSLVSKTRKEFFEGKKFNVTKLWFLLMFEMWYERWIE